MDMCIRGPACRDKDLLSSVFICMYIVGKNLYQLRQIYTVFESCFSERERKWRRQKKWESERNTVESEMLFFSRFFCKRLDLFSPSIFDASSFVIRPFSICFFIFLFVFCIILQRQPYIFSLFCCFFCFF